MKITLSPPPGLTSDDTTHALPGRYGDGNNVRFWNELAQVIGGWAGAFSDILTGVCRNALAWDDKTARQTIAFGTHSALQVYRGGMLYTVTPSGLTTGSVDTSDGYGAGGYGNDAYGTTTLGAIYSRTWSLQNFGEYLLASPRGGGLYVWQNDTSALATQVTSAPAVIGCVLVTPERQVLLFGVNEELSGTFNPMAIRGSDLETFDVYTTSDANNAFEHILEGGGRIIAARMLAGQVAVWTDTGLHLGTYVGAAGQAYRFDRVASNCGCVGPNAVAVLGQTAYWVTPDFQVWSWQIGAPPAQVHCPIRDDFAANVVEGQSVKIVACSVSKFSEVWFFYPDSRDGVENSRYIALLTTVDPDTAWFRGQLARTAAIDEGAVRYPLFVTYGGNAYFHENGNTADGSAMSWSLDTTDFFIGQAEQWVLARGIWPDFEGQVGPVTLTLNFKPYPQATATTKGPYALAPGASKKDFMGQGRIVSLKFSGMSAPSYMRMGKPTLDVVVTGSQ